VVTNHPPIANNNGYTRNSLSGWKIAVADLLTNATDLDMDALTLVTIGVSTNNITLDTTTFPGFVTYYNPNPVNDRFNYTVRDNYGGTNSGTIALSYSNTNGITSANSIVSITGTNPKVLTAYGIPNYTYVTERSTNLVTWVGISTNTAATNGVITVTDAFDDFGNVAPNSAYYRLEWK